jgi:hypothetical protein
VRGLGPIGACYSDRPWTDLGPIRALVGSHYRNAVEYCKVLQLPAGLALADKPQSAGTLGWLWLWLWGSLDRGVRVVPELNSTLKQQEAS